MGNALMEPRRLHPPLPNRAMKRQMEEDYMAPGFFLSPLYGSEATG